MVDYYINDGETTHGPLPLNKALDMIAQENIDPDNSLGWHQGLSEWKLLKDIPDLSQKSQNAPNIEQVSLDDKIVLLVQLGKKLEAIQVYRETYNTSLASAKAFIEELEEDRKDKPIDNSRPSVRTYDRTDHSHQEKTKKAKPFLQFLKGVFIGMIATIGYIIMFKISSFIIGVIALIPILGWILAIIMSIALLLSIIVFPIKIAVRGFQESVAEGFGRICGMIFMKVGVIALILFVFKAVIVSLLLAIGAVPIAEFLESIDFESWR